MNDLGFAHRFVPAPAIESSARTLLLLHGTGGDENDLIDLGHAIDPRAALLSPRGQVLERGAPRFFRRLAEGVFDEEDVAVRARELAGFVEAATTRYAVEPERLVAVGYSNGANIAAAIMLLNLAVFPRAILFRAMVPLSNLQPAPITPARVLIAEGQFDPIAQPENGRRLAEMLRAGGAEVDLIFQSAGHELTSEDLTAAQKWLAS